MSELASGLAPAPATAAEKAAKTTERMKTETIHAQAMQLEYMRLRLISLEEEVKQLTKENRSLGFKLKAAQRHIEQQGETHGS